MFILEKRVKLKYTKKCPLNNSVGMGQVIIFTFRPQREGSNVSDFNLSLKTAITQLFNIILFVIFLSKICFLFYIFDQIQVIYRRWGAEGS